MCYTLIIRKAGCVENRSIGDCTAAAKPSAQSLTPLGELVKSEEATLLDKESLDRWLFLAGAGVCDAKNCRL